MFHKLEMQKGIKYNLAAQRNSSTNAHLQIVFIWTVGADPDFK